ncbi:phosphoenolpyruvate mutase [Micromonospora sp. WMMD1120]|uniref:phosphoenolpyruvate mutase n=1 Tax=Micromonospora sp. WMMD1120 TaxID=3016106 RepID=UPI00241658FF|nr:phosphoenolpyruvate mutase [Micromonospora sp. WMMD1120]MDG4808723.1 phosphoenolpyruvate mutase [Micromonospora sp. WMMD1120]
MTKTAALRNILSAPSIARIMGAHSPLSARMASEADFDAIWASGLEISALAGVPDANILSMSQSLQAAADIAAAVDIPVLADCDSGFGNVNNVVDMVQRYERAGIAGVCIEDKQYPKLNSFVEGNQDLAPVRDFTAKIIAATQVRTDPDFVVVARIEALIAGAGMDEALRRAEAYASAGADALLIHSKQSSPDQVCEFRQRFPGEIPLVVVPTTYHTVTAADLEALGFGAVIYANHALRGSIAAMQEVLEQIIQDGTSHHVESRIASLSRVFELQGMGRMLEQQVQFEKLAEARLAELELSGGGL